MDPLRHATTLNNLGVYLLESNNTLGAINTFQKAVRLLKDSTNVSSSITTTTTTTTTTTATSFENSVVVNESHQLPNSHDQLQLQCTPSTQTYPSSSTNTIISYQPSFSCTALCRPGKKLPHLNQRSEYYIFDRALLLPSNLSAFIVDDRSGDDTGNDTVDIPTFIASTIAIFNFAIACHLNFIQQNQTSGVHQAIQLYQLTLRMIHEANLEQDNFFEVIMCLSLNNMANIFYQLSEYRNCSKCMSCLDDILTNQNPNFAVDSSALEFICETDWADIKINLLVLKSPSAAHAA